MATDPAAFAAVIMTMGIPIVAIWTGHQRKMAEIKMRSGNIQGSSVQGSVLEDVRLQLSALREEIAALRDTSTKFDVSFDSALSRLEERVDRLDTSPMSVAPPYPLSAASTAATAGAEPDRVVIVGNGR
jgi:hypothetical protein